MEAKPKKNNKFPAIKIKMKSKEKIRTNKMEIIMNKIDLFKLSVF